MSIDFKQNYFELFELPVQFTVDNAQLATAFRALQAQHHPDRFASESDEARRVAQQVTSFINTDFDDERDTTSDMMFLMSQMERREVLEQVPNADDPFDAIDAFSKDVKAENKSLEDAFEKAYDAGDLDEAKQAVLKLKFFERLLGEVKQLEEKLEDEAL